MDDNTKIYLGEKAAEMIAHGVDEEIKKRATNYSLCADGDGIQIDGGFGGRIFSSDLDYSTEEQLTGKRWIDGKPIYQKTIVEDCEYTGTYNKIRYFYKTLISNVDSLIDSYGKIKFDNNNGIKTCSFPIGEGNWNGAPSMSGYTLMDPETTDVKFYLVINIDNYTFTSFKLIATILYTKISDTELSPVSLPKIKSIHNYSINEQVVGTWIDGKPIYERVICGTMNGSPVDWTDFYDCSNFDIDKIIDIKGYFDYAKERQIYLNDRYSTYTFKYDNKMIQYYNTQLKTDIYEVVAIIQYTKTTD